MARISRKKPETEREVPDKAENLVAFYLRLSDPDERSGTSESIENQKSLLSDYIKDKSEFRLVSTYIDDGKTGTNFRRPGFEAMMQDVKKGLANCIMVKDLSRFGRNFLESGNYIENIFPFLGVRFIAVTDGFDTLTSSASEMAFLMPLKNMMNENYARDISVKERSAKKMLRKKGCFLGAHAIYGYIKSKQDKHKLCIDPEAAGVVRMIFDMGEQGCSDIAIARHLNEQNIWSPAKYKYEKGILHHEKYAKSVGWYPQTVAMILNSRAYVGDMVQGGYCSTQMKGKRSVQPKEQWDIVPNQHEAIISMEQFERVAQIRAGRHKKYMAGQGMSGKKEEKRPFAHQGTENILKGKVFCANCKTALERKYIRQCSDKYRFICGVHEKGGGCQRKYIAESDLHAALLVVIKSRIELVSDINHWLTKNRMNQWQKLESMNHEITAIQNELERLKQAKGGLYDDWKSGLIDKVEFQFLKESYQKKIMDREIQLQSGEKECAEYINNCTLENPVMKSTKPLSTKDLLSREVIELLIDRIEICEHHRIKVYLKFEDELKAMMDYINKSEQEADNRIA